MRIRPPFFALMLLAFSCLPFVSSCNAAPKAPSVVSVDMQRLMTESEPAKQASEHLKQVRAVLQKGFEELRETYEGTPKDERETILANGLAALNRQMELETRAASRTVGVPDSRRGKKLSSSGSQERAVPLPVRPSVKHDLRRPEERRTGNSTGKAHGSTAVRYEKERRPAS